LYHPHSKTLAPAIEKRQAKWDQPDDGGPNRRSTMSRIETVDAYRLEVPLIAPYRLSFGDVLHYDTVITVITDDSGRRAAGEATVLTGYTDETITDCWQQTRHIAQSIAGHALESAASRLPAWEASHPFTTTAFATAIEQLLNPAIYRVPVATPVPLLGLLDAKDPDDMHREADRLIAAGYRTMKVKVGFDVDHDTEKVRWAQQAVNGRARIRIDANQGFDRARGIRFMQQLDPQDIELFEQPCPAGDWDSHCAVASASPVPMMLDESIYGMPDIEKAAALRCAAFIKLKLMKLVTLERLISALHRIRELGMTPVLGNGVACDLGCWHETLAAAQAIDNAGEMNGFLKTGHTLLAQALPFAQGRIMLPRDFSSAIDMQQLAVVTRERFTASGRTAQHTAQQEQTA
jgi:L-alanine-DL-glutamate epimerase-like enolase superfamily enzyme